MLGLPSFLTPDGREIDAKADINRKDLVKLGYSTPPYSGSFRINVSYKRFDLNTNFYYVLGGIKEYNYSSFVVDDSNANRNGIKNQTNDMWFKPGDENKKYYSPFPFVENLVLFPNSRTVGSSNYLRMSMLSLRYRFPKIYESIKYSSIALQASNLFTITAYKESNPESGTMAGTQQPVVTLNYSITF